MNNLPDRPSPPKSVAERLQQWLTWVGPGRVAAAAVAVLAVLAGAYWLVRPPAATTESRLPYAGTPSTASAPTGPDGTEVATTALPTVPTPSAQTQLVVHVAGAVVAPGVYRVSDGARVVDAIEVAGGLAADADLDAVNLAAPVRDGERLYVPRVGQPVPSVVTGGGGGVPPGEGGGDGPAAPSGPININTATAAELEALPGVGPATAAAIVAHRDEHGPFATVDDLTDVTGIGPAKLEAVRGLVTV